MVNQLGSVLPLQCAQDILCSLHLFPDGLHSRKYKTCLQVAMIGRKNSVFPFSTLVHAKSVLLESRKVVTLSVGSHCHETWEMFFVTFESAASLAP